MKAAGTDLVASEVLGELLSAGPFAPVVVELNGEEMRVLGSRVDSGRVVLEVDRAAVLSWSVAADLIDEVLSSSSIREARQVAESIAGQIGYDITPSPR